MKKTKLIIQLLFLSLLIACSVFNVTDAFKADLEQTEFKQTYNKVLKQDTVDISDIDQIFLNCYTENISISFSESASKMELLEKGFCEEADNCLFSFTKDGSVLTISGETEETYKTDRMLSINITLPKNFQRNLTINESSGNIEFIDEVKLAQLDIKQQYGEVAFKDKLNVDSLVITQSAGCLDARSISTQKYAIHNQTGNIDINGLSGEGEIQTVTGGIEVLYSSISGDSSIDSNNGNVDLTFNKECSAKVYINNAFGSTDSFNETIESSADSSEEIYQIGKESSTSLKITSNSSMITLEQK